MPWSPVPLVLHDAVLLDGTGADPRPGVSVVIESGSIVRIAPARDLTLPRDAEVIDLGGRFLLPGLTDAHVHFGLTEPDGTTTRPLAAYALKVARFIEETLDQGFTTVRDAGGLDPAWAGAVERGLLRGPRILPSGAFLSQTGGHGDFRAPYDDAQPAPVPGLLAGSVLCDGPDEVRRAARDQLRRGATQIKVMASGGAASPTDPIEATQFTVEELRAAVEEAAARDTYVLAHAYHPRSIANCLDAGVRSIEHGNLLDEATAYRMAREGAFLVPTLIVFEALSRHGAELGLSRYSLEKIERVKATGAQAVRLAAEAGVRIGSGSDLLGHTMARKAEELVLKARILGPMQAIVSATKVNAELFGLADRIGVVAEGKEADLIVVDGDPLADIATLADAERIPLVVKGGAVVKRMELPSERPRP
ncbi:MAG TPA: amidohydrolase family protein [Dehalococcoidia bacterium]|nr:amidohydrolase family protein [Dehalococcoidia bacterium]